MRILILSPSYSPVVGGLQMVAGLLAKFFKNTGHEVEVITNRYPRTLKPQETIDNIVVRRMLFLYPRRRDIVSGRIDLWCASLFFYPYTCFRLYKLVRCFKPDVINLHFPDHQVPVVLWLKKKFKFRLVVSFHGHDIRRWFNEDDYTVNIHAKKNNSFRQLKMLVEEAGVVTACSRFLLERTIELIPSVRDKGVVIHNGIDLDFFRNKIKYEHAAPYILCIGRLVCPKGFDLALDAFQRISGTYPLLELIIAGDGVERQRLESEVLIKGLSNRVRFTGDVSQETVRRLLNGCEFLIMPSRVEMFGIVIIEAMAAQKAVLATRSGGPEEIITDGVNGLLIEKNNVEELTKAMLRLLENINLRDNLITNANKTIHYFSETNMGLKYLEVFKGHDYSLRRGI